MAKNPGEKLSEPNDSPKIIKDKIKKPRLLIIAADDDIRQSAVLAGGKENFAVRAVDNGSDALNLLINTDYKPFELLIVEHSLPGMGSDVDDLSTMVVDGTQLKVFAWYDNEWGYSCRMADLVCHVVGLEE